MNKKQKGFSLLEVLVALAIFAIVAIAAYQQVAASAQASARIEQKLMAAWLAENVLEQYFVERKWPTTGEDVIEYEMAGREWYVVVNVGETDDKDIRLLDATVYEDRSSKNSIINMYRLIGKQ